MAIPLSQGLFALVDGEDYQRLAKYKWYAQKDGNRFYACRNKKNNGKSTKVTMHREIMRSLPFLFIDHVNGSGLDNRKQNLRLCTNRENSYNQKPREKGTSKYKGVSWKENKSKWCAQISVKSKKKHLGYFDNEINAAKAYDVAAQEYAGEFAKTNFE